VFWGSIAQMQKIFRVSRRYHKNVGYVYRYSTAQMCHISSAPAKLKYSTCLVFLGSTVKYNIRFLFLGSITNVTYAECSCRAANFRHTRVQLHLSRQQTAYEIMQLRDANYNVHRVIAAKHAGCKSKVRYVS